MFITHFHITSLSLPGLPAGSCWRPPLHQTGSGRPVPQVIFRHAVQMTVQVIGSVGILVPAYERIMAQHESPSLPVQTKNYGLLHRVTQFCVTQNKKIHTNSECHSKFVWIYSEFYKAKAFKPKVRMVKTLFNSVFSKILR